MAAFVVGQDLFGGDGRGSSDEEEVEEVEERNPDIASVTQDLINVDLTPSPDQQPPPQHQGPAGEGLEQVEDEGVEVGVDGADGGGGRRVAEPKKQLKCIDHVGGLEAKLSAAGRACGGYEYHYADKCKNCKQPLDGCGKMLEKVRTKQGG